ncbi:MAG: IS110 family transposase [Planctomycetaceae bacterium]|nr:IS110 family transposase [Planctomycetaceae bacterium]
MIARLACREHITLVLAPLVILDDAQTDELAANEDRVVECKRKIDTTVEGLEGFQGLSIIYCGTRINRNCMTSYFQRDKRYRQIYIPLVDSKGKVTWDAFGQERADRIQRENPSMFWTEYQNMPELEEKNKSDLTIKSALFDAEAAVAGEHYAGIDVGLRELHFVVMRGDSHVVAADKFEVKEPIAGLRELIGELRSDYPGVRIGVDVGWKQTEILAAVKDMKDVFCTKGVGISEKNMPITEYKIHGDTIYLDEQGEYFVTARYGGRIYQNDTNLIKERLCHEVNSGSVAFCRGCNTVLLRVHLNSERGQWKRRTHPSPVKYEIQTPDFRINSLTVKTLRNQALDDFACQILFLLLQPIIQNTHFGISFSAYSTIFISKPQSRRILLTQSFARSTFLTE